MKKIFGTTILVGFILLSVFGFISINNSESIISCVASSAGISCNVNGSDFNVANHNLNSYQAITGVFLSIFVFLIFFVVFLAQLGNFALLSKQLPVSEYLSNSNFYKWKESINSWLSLFELSPAK